MARRAILGGLLFTPACMRRFIVIFLLLLLPLQVTAEVLDDLRIPQHRAILLQAIDVASTSTDTRLKRSTLSHEASSPQQAVHADISDSVSSAAPNVHSAPLVDLWPDYRPFPFPSVYFPVIKPPRI